MRKIIKKLFKTLGYTISKKNDEREVKLLTLDEIYSQKLKSSPLIFDVGANNGQSIKRFSKLFEKPVIHAFEPNIREFKNLEKKFSKSSNIKLNNMGIGDKEEIKEFNVAAHSENSSFIKPKLNTKWIELRSEQAKIEQSQYILSKEKVKIDTIDNYCLKNNIKHIDILKIDTQLYEDKVLEGCKNIIDNQLVDAIELEIVFSKVYEKYFSFSDIEKYLVTKNYRFSAIQTHNNNLFSGSIFFAVVLYLNKKKFDLD